MTEQLLKDMIRKNPKIVHVERSKYFSYKEMLPTDAVVEQLYNDKRYQNIAREFEKRPDEEPTFAKSAGEAISLLLGSTKKITSKEKVEIYKMAYKNGAHDGIEYMKHYFAGNNISKEKLEKLTKFLHDEGIEIAVSPNGGICVCNMWEHPEKFIEWRIEYE